MAVPTLILAAGSFCLVCAFYLLIKFWRNYTHWSQSGLPFIPFPRDVVFYPCYKGLTLQKFYNQLAPHPVGGFYKMSRPYLMVRDPELVRIVLIKGFSHFINHNHDIDGNLDPLDLHIFNLKDDRWRGLRQKISPAFSPGKLKGIWPQILECQGELHKFLDHELETENESEVEVTDLMRKFGLDVIGRCFFGLGCNALALARGEGGAGAEGRIEREFQKMVASFFKPSSTYFVRSLLRAVGLDPTLVLRWKRMDPAIEEFFFSFIRDCIKLREEESSTGPRKDVMQYLLDLQHEEREQLRRNNDASEPLLTDAVVAAHLFIFFSEGTETNGLSLAYVLYQLALHPEVVAKCRQELKMVLDQHGGALTYESIKDMIYLQCVIDETLRLHPAGAWLARLCEEAFEAPDKSFTIKRGTRLVIPVYGLHMDPNYFPEPEKFKPERFSEENKGSIQPGTYLPFGDGPRMCIGYRFALMEMKLAVASLILRYDLEPTEKTDIPIRFMRSTIIPTPSNGIWLRFRKSKM